MNLFNVCSFEILLLAHGYLGNTSPVLLSTVGVDIIDVRFCESEVSTMLIGGSAREAERLTSPLYLSELVRRIELVPVRLFVDVSTKKEAICIKV